MDAGNLWALLINITSRTMIISDIRFAMAFLGAVLFYWYFKVFQGVFDKPSTERHITAKNKKLQIYRYRLWLQCKYTYHLGSLQFIVPCLQSLPSTSGSSWYYFSRPPPVAWNPDLPVHATAHWLQLITTIERHHHGNSWFTNPCSMARCELCIVVLAGQPLNPIHVLLTVSVRMNTRTVVTY